MSHENDHTPRKPSVKRTLFADARTAGKAAEGNLNQLKRGLEKLKEFPPEEIKKNEPTEDTTQTASSSSSSPVKKISRK